MGTITLEIYIKECLEKRLKPVLRQHKVSTYFWPDLASCHYSKLPMEGYSANNVLLVPRGVNPPNCPELRPIERYWTLVKREIKATKQVTKEVKDFREKWSSAARKVSNNTIKSLIKGVPEKLKFFFK